MAKAIKANGSTATDAWAEIDLGSNQAEIWITADIAFTAAALAMWISDGQSSKFAQIWKSGHAFETDYLWFVGGQWGNFEGQGTPPAPVGDTWQTCEQRHVAGGAVELYVDEILATSNTTGITDQSRFVQFGNVLAILNPDNIAYLKNLKVGTTRGGNDLFEWNGEDLSQFTSLSGDISVVSDPYPEIASPTQVFGGTRFYEAPPWRIIVGDLEDNTLTFLDHLALDRSITVTRAAARVMSGRVPSDNPEVNILAPDPDSEPFLSEGTRLVSYFRREAPSGSNEKPWICRGRGLILSLGDDADTDHATSPFTAYDPWKYLYRRPVLNPETEEITDYSYPAGARASEIIIEQFDLAILNGTIFTDYGQTAFYNGTIEPTEPLPDDGDGLAMTFRAGTTLGEMLDLLVATGTCDVVFDPIYDVVNRPGLLCELSIYEVAGAFKPNAVMGWDRWPRSLVQLSRQVEGTERANMVQMYAGQGGPAVDLEQDAASLAKFGEYWALQYLPGVPSLAGAHTIAQRQLALLKDGQYTYAISPASERAPLLFEEYREADMVPVYASDRFRDPLSGIPVRVESIPIVIGDDELERVNQMLVSFAPESGS